MRKRFHAPLKVLYLVSFLFSGHTAFTSYVNSSFLSDCTSHCISDSTVGLLFTLASLLAIVSLANIPDILVRFGNRFTLTSILILSVASLIGLVFITNPVLAALTFVAYLSLNTLFFFGIDIFIEEYTAKGKLGGTRGTLLAITSMAWVVSPLIAGLVLAKTGSFPLVYAIAIGFVLFSLGFFATHERSLKEPQFKRRPFHDVFWEFMANKNLRMIFFAALLLQIFFSWMVIYSPIFLHEHIGLPWSHIGIIFAIMLSAYVFFDIPLGKLADEKYGEREILIGGFVFAAILTGIMSFVTSTEWWVWALILFGTRMGAAGIQVMTESYFFKHVNARSAGKISLFRETVPLGYIIGPLTATFLLSVFDLPIQYLFIVLSAILLLGVFPAFILEDTK